MDFGVCEKVAGFIMRPPRTTYELDDLGPKCFLFEDKYFERIDFEVVNMNRNKLKCSFFQQKFNEHQRQTVVFLHANSSSRLAAKNYLAQVLPHFNIVCFDSSGSGQSQGQYVTLGYNQKQDLLAVVKQLKKQYGISNVILWGRSMGAVTALLFAAKYPQYVRSIVSDNAFSDLQSVCNQLKDKYFPLIPDFLVGTLLDNTQDYINQNLTKNIKNSFQLKRLKPKQIVNKISAPIFYLYSEQDKMVNSSHTKQLYSLSQHPKRIHGVSGDHNGKRDTETKCMIVQFLIGVNQAKQKKQTKKLQVCIPHKKTYLEEEDSNNQENFCMQSSFQKVQYESPLNKRLYLSIHNKNSDKIKRTKKVSMSEVKKQNKVSEPYTHPFRSHISINEEEDQNQLRSLKTASEISSSLNMSTKNRKRKRIFNKC